MKLAVFLFIMFIIIVFFRYFNGNKKNINKKNVNDKIVDLEKDPVIINGKEQIGRLEGVKQI